MDERKAQARWLALLAMTAVALYGCWLMLEPFLGVLTWAVVLVITFRPLQERLLARTRRPALSALLSSVLVVLAILVPLVFTVLAAARQLPDFARNAQEVFTGLLNPDAPVLGGVLRWLGRYVDLEQLRSPQFLAQHLQDLAGPLAGRALGLAGGLVGVLVQAFFVVFAMYYLFRDGPRFAHWLVRVLPLEEAQGEEILKRTREMIEASVYGVIVLAVVQGALGGLAFFVLGLPNALLWGAVMVVLSVIPVTGSFLVWAPAAVYLAATGHWGKALLLTAWGLLVIGLIDNFLRPKVMGQKAGLHELLIFFAVLGGLVVFGVTGLVLGPVLLAVTLGLLDVIRLADQPPEAIRHEPGLAEQTAAIADAAGAGHPGGTS
jgi:predicted PurR-regulated permease PerM